MAAGFPHPGRHSQAGLFRIAEDFDVSMTAFSATEAAFEGFRVARERPWAIVAWAGVALAMSVARIVLTGALADVAALGQLQQLMADPHPDVTRILAIAGEQLPFLAAFLPISLLYYGILFAAAFRVVLEPGSSVNGLRIGIQELRQVLLILLLASLLFVADIGVLFLAGLVWAVAAAISKVLGGFVAFVGFLAWVVFVVVVPIRLSLAGPDTFAEHRFKPFHSWRMTRGHFWPMLGAYVFATIFAIVIVLLGWAILAGLFAFGGTTIQQMLIPPAHLGDYLQPFRLIYLVGSAFISAQAFAILACPAAAIFRQLNREAVA
jgi:hypothetical protein